VQSAYSSAVRPLNSVWISVVGEECIKPDHSGAPKSKEVEKRVIETWGDAPGQTVYNPLIEVAGFS
jgi:hypothetical protein